MDKEECTIILTFLCLIYFWKRFIDDIFISLGSHSQHKSLMTIMNATSPTIKYTFTYSKQTAFFLDVQIYLFESRKFKTKLYKNQPAAWHYFTSTLTIHSAVKKVSFIPWYYLIISEDHILQEELYNLTHILLACSYLLHLIIKNIKKALTHNCNYLLSQRTPQT